MILGFLRAFALALLGLPVTLAGFPVVWFALPFAKSCTDPKPFSQFWNQGSWSLVRLPKWALWWDNAFDGMLGDKRGWWANECQGKHTSRFNMWRWAAVRNPANYFSRVICGVDVSDLRIMQVAQHGIVEQAPFRGFYLLKGMAEGGKMVPRFYAEFALWKSYGLMIDIGWKIKLSHNGRTKADAEADRLKGSVFTISLWKELS